MQKRRNKYAALKLLRRLLKNQGIHAEMITTDKPASYRAALWDLGLTGRHRPGGMRENNRAGNSQLAIRRRAKAAEVQIPRLSPEISLQLRRRLQHLQHPALSDLPTWPLKLANGPAEVYVSVSAR